MITRRAVEAEPVHIVFASDDRYARQLMVAATSIVTNSASPIHFHILNDGLSPANQEMLRSLLAARDCAIEVLEIDPSWLRHFPYCEGYSRTTYLRLKLPSCLAHLEKCIYLDPDLIVRHDIAGLWNFDLQGKALAAVKDIEADFLNDFKKKLGVADEHVYFNAGVLLLDLARLRQIGFEEKAVAFAKAHPERISIVDQDILNYLLQDDVAYFPLAWNFSPLWYHDGSLRNWAWRNLQRFYPPDEQKAAEADPAIVHYANRIKPWHCTKEAMQHPFYGEYSRYVELLRAEMGHCQGHGGENGKLPAISVVVPIYNVDPYLNKCLDSILAQSFTDFEVIAVDDGATDRSGTIIDEYAKWDSRVKPIHKENGGLGSAYNAGLAKARGQYIAFVEPDDWVAGNLLECLHRKAEESRASITKCSFFLAHSDTCWEDYRKFRNVPPGAASYVFSQMRDLPCGHLGFWAGLYRRDFLEKNGLRFLELPGAGYVDTHFFWTSHAKADTIAIVDRPLYYYRQDNPGASLKCTDRRFFVLVENYRQIRRELMAAGIYGEVKSNLLKVQYSAYLSVFGRLQPQFKEEFAAMIAKDLCEIDEIVLTEGGFSKEDRRNVNLLVQGRFYRDWARRMALADSVLVQCGQLGITLLRNPSSLVSEEFWSLTPLRRKLYGLFRDPSIGRDLLRLRQTATATAVASVSRYLFRDALPASLILCRLALKVGTYPLRGLARGIRTLLAPSRA